jgi:hypothetical protein
MEVVQLEKFKRGLKVRQTIAIHDLGENQEMMAVERSADEMDQSWRSAEGIFHSWSESSKWIPTRPLRNASRQAKMYRRNICSGAPTPTTLQPCSIDVRHRMRLTSWPIVLPAGQSMILPVAQDHVKSTPTTDQPAAASGLAGRMYANMTELEITLETLQRDPWPSQGTFAPVLL